ncbi:LPS export ABC transporter permease LptG [Kordiimonas laminariae]|uniref:LPS export ABC transporter permease LptG n=1 Tax=Kordiimonas laminariae TaxID=2917717 RepID=UPI001FF4632D|nr:LPS export ABC transporter permease LptG [Kordiimonas laminariae]MCK0070968.1 LPS export ABC transporter permease LptG [Kordiimonas laminariae]
MVWRTIRRTMVPSRTLARYMIKMHLSRFFGVLVGLTAVLQFLDLLAVSDDIMAADGATWVSIVSYLSMRTPQLLSQFAPFAALISTLLTLATLNQHSEVVIMKASGLSAHRILLPMGLASFIIAIGHFTFNETVVVDGSARLEYWKDNDFAVDLPPNSNLTGRVWVKEDENIILVEAVNAVKDGAVMDKVSVFERDQNKKITAMIQADFALYQKGKWSLHEVRRFDAISHELTVDTVKDWPIKTRPERFMALTANPDHVSFIELWSSMAKLNKEGIPIDRMMASFMQKFAAPASTLLMPLLAAVAAFGVTRAGSLAIRLTVGMALGFSFFVADNFMLAMGEFGVAPPFLAAWAPFFLFLLVGYAVLFHTEEGTKRRRSPSTPAE